MADPLIVARPRPGPQARPGDFGGGVGQVQVAEGISNLAAVGEKVTDAEYRSRAALALARSGMQLQEAAAAIDADPDVDPRDYDAAFAEDVQKIRAETSSDLPSAYRATFDSHFSGYAAKTRLDLIASGQKRQLENANANFTETLKLLADQESRAESPGEKAMIQRQVGELLGYAKARRVYTPAETARRQAEYESAVVGAALARGLADHPTETRIALEQELGPFARGRMSEEDRAKAILAAQRREEQIAAAAEIKQRYDQREGRRQETEEARMVMSKVYNEAVSPQGLSAENGALYMQMLTKHPDLAGGVARILENGGRLRSGEPDRAYYGRLNNLLARDPAAFARLEVGTNQSPNGVDHLDPELLGNRYVAFADLHREVASGSANYARSNHEAALLRWFQVKEHLIDTPLLNIHVHDMGQHALDVAEGDFWNRVELAQRDYRDGPGKGKDARGPEFTKLLDGVVMDLADKYHYPEVGHEVSDPSLAPETATTTTTTRPTTTTTTLPPVLEGISRENVETVRGWLIETAVAPTPEAIREAYDRMVAIGAIVP